MLNINGLSNFWYLRNFHDMRCKYDRLRSVIHQQLNREPQDDDVFIVMSKDRRKVRMFTYDRRSCCMHEKRFSPTYRFMKVEHDGDEDVYSIDWRDVQVLMNSPVVKTLNVK